MKYFILLTAVFLFSCKGNESQKKTITQRKPCDLEFLVHLDKDENVTDYEVFEFLESFQAQNAKIMLNTANTVAKYFFFC